jgi:alpha-tubulin suppressor-like RCC1 family protein
MTDNVVDFWLGGGHTASVYALKTDGNIYACGYNGYGQLGVGDKANKHTWQLVSSLVNKNITKMYMSGYDTATTAYARSADNKLYAAGYNAYGQIGIGVTGDQTNFVRSHTPTTPVQFRSYSSAYGNGHGFAVYADENGQLYGAGAGSYRLFDDESSNKYSWTKIAGRL